MRENLETCSDKLILSNKLCDLASIILKNKYWVVRVPSKKRFCYWNQVHSSIF